VISLNLDSFSEEEENLAELANSRGLGLQMVKRETISNR